MTARDRNGAEVSVGTRIRIVSLSGGWLDELPPDKHARVMSMIGEVFEVEEFDDYGHPWVSKTWPIDGEFVFSHSLALDAAEMELAESQPTR